MLNALPNETLIQTPFGVWRHNSLKPPEDLSDAVEEFWEVEGVAGFYVEKHVPQGKPELMFNLGNHHDVLDLESLKVRQTYKKNWLSGMQEKPVCVAPTKTEKSRREHIVSARLTAQGVYLLFGIPAEAFKNQVIELSDVFHQGPDQVQEQLGNAATPAERFAILSGYLRDIRQARGRVLSGSVTWALTHFQENAGNLRIQQICDEFGVSRKHLNSLFRTEIGISPKRYSRILKFGHAINFLKTAPVINWAEVAAFCGYFDQAHFIREFKTFSGVTPGEFIKLRGPDSSSLIVEDPSR